MSNLLRVAAVYSLLWAIGLAFAGRAAFGGDLTPEMRSLGNCMAIASLALAYLFFRASKAPLAERGVLYAALVNFGLRGIVGTVEVLYLLEGHAAMLRLVDMVVSMALFVGMLNALPDTLLAQEPAEPGDGSSL